MLFGVRLAYSEMTITFRYVKVETWSKSYSKYTKSNFF